MPRSIDLNADIGEGFPWDEPLLHRVTSVSIACGAHAGSPDLALKTLRLTPPHVRIGAHPGYADPNHFGRVELSLTPEDLTRLLTDQIMLLLDIARSIGRSLDHVKLHGALYNQAQRDPAIAATVVLAVAPFRLPLFGLPDSTLEAQAIATGLPFIREGFADRAYDAHGRLLPRSSPGAILSNPHDIAAQALRLVESGIQTLCLHGDDPHAVEHADLLQSTFQNAGILIKPYMLSCPNPFF